MTRFKQTGLQSTAKFWTLIPAILGLILISSGCAFRGYADSELPPEPPREFRGLWIATVANINWPSQPGLPAAEQRQELKDLIERAHDLNFNAIILQVRPTGDTIYPSKIEPWSEYLTGASGHPPKPFYDPLLFAISETHRHGMELHAWINPFRARHSSAKSRTHPNHASERYPDMVKSYGSLRWMDPGEPQVRAHAKAVIKELIQNYDIDGLHMDDYFYPYRDASIGDFPDDASWRRYGARSRLSRDDWRRQNVNQFIQDVYYLVKKEKPWIKVGISPFGIWRPGHPPQIRGRDNYAEEYADTRLWLRSGWLDYCAPQLYWKITAYEQSFPALLDWWTRQNSQRRHIWPGLNATNVRLKGWDPSEIEDQIRLTRNHTRSSGFAIYSSDAILEGTQLGTALEKRSLDGPALIPASPWLSRRTPRTPRVELKQSGADLYLRWRSPDNDNRLWVYQTRDANGWRTEILPLRSVNRVYSFPTTIKTVAISAVNRYGTLSRPRILTLQDQQNPSQP